MKKYYPELIIFGAILSAYMIVLAPDLTWSNVCADSAHLLYASKYLYLAHKTSAPLYLLLGHLFLYIPIGTEYWRMGLISVLGGIGTCLFIYLTIRASLPAPMSDSKKRLYALIGVLVYGGSALAFSQTSIAKYYTLITMFCVGAYYFAVVKKWAWSAVMLGLGLATHHLIGLVLIPLFYFNRDFRKWKYVIIMDSFLLFYLYFPFSVLVMHSPSMWSNATPIDFVVDLTQTFLTLVGALSIWDFPKRVLDTIGILGISLGLAIIPIAWYFIRQKQYTGKTIFRNQLFWIFGLGIVYFSTDLDMSVYTYMLPTVAFGAIIGGTMLRRLNIRWAYAVGLVAIGLLLFNTNYFDIGRTLDKDMSAVKFYKEELPKIPDGQILLAQGGWDWGMVYLYNKNEGRNIISIYTGALYDPKIQEQLRAQGVKFIDSNAKELIIRQSEIASSIAEFNDGVWTTQFTESESMGEEVVPTNHNGALLVQIPPSFEPQWKFMPSNPYRYISGKLSVKEWKFITYTYGTRSVLFFIIFISFGLFANWFLNQKVKAWRTLGQRKAHG